MYGNVSTTRYTGSDGACRVYHLQHLIRVDENRIYGYIFVFELEWQITADDSYPSY